MTSAESEVVIVAEKRAPIIFGDEPLSDMTLFVGNQDFKIHKMVLASRSDVFKTMFYGDFKESKEDRVEIKDVSVENFRRFLEIVYSGKASDPSKFLEFPFTSSNQHHGVVIKPEEVEHADDTYLYSPSYQKLFHNFWCHTTEILNIADRFNLVAPVKDYFGYIISFAFGRCKKDKGCHQCFNMLILALINGIDVSTFKRKHESSYYQKWFGYATEAPFPETIPVKVTNTIFQQFLE